MSRPNIDNKLFNVSEVICVKCYHRWIGIREKGISLKDIECINCHETGYVINTGEVLNERTCELCKLWKGDDCKLKLSHNIYDAEYCDYYEEK